MPPLREPLPARVVTVICAGAVGALGAAVFLRLFVDLWLPATDADARLHSEPVVVLLALPVGLFAGTLFRGVASAVSYWVGAFVGVLAMAYSSGWSGFAALAALLFLAIIPQALIAGFLVARGIDRPMSGSSRTGMARIARIFVVPSVVSLVLVGLVALVDAAAVRATDGVRRACLIDGSSRLGA